MSLYGKRFISEYIRWKSKGRTDLSKIIDYFGSEEARYGELSYHPYLRWKDVKKRISRRWDWNQLSDHPMLTWKIVSKNKDRPWNWYHVSRQPFVTWELIKHSKYPFDLRGFVEGPNITYETIQKMLDDMTIRWGEIIINLLSNRNADPLWVLETIDNVILQRDATEPGVADNMPEIIEFMCGHPLISLALIKKLGRRVDLDAVSSNDDATEEILEYLIKLYPEFTICSRSKLSLKFIEKYVDKIGRYYLSYNPNISIDLVLKHKEGNWYWLGLSKRMHISDVLAHPELPWNPVGLVVNPTMTLDILVSLVDEDDITRYFCDSHLFSLEFIMKNMHMRWNFAQISARVTIEDIENHPEIPWVWNYVLGNPNIPYDFVMKHEHKFNSMKSLQSNHLDLKDLCIDWREPPTGKIEVIERDLKRRHEGVKKEIVPIYGRDVSSVILLYVSYR